MKPPMSKQASGCCRQRRSQIPTADSGKSHRTAGHHAGGYNIHPLIDALDDAKLAPIAAKALSHTLLMFDNFYDVEEKAKAGNEYAKQVMQSGRMPNGS